MDKEFRAVMTAGIVGIAGILLTIISDIILLGRPVSSQEFFRLGTISMVNLDLWRLPFGSIMGIMSLPLQIAGLWHIYYALKPAGKWWSWPVVLILAHALSMGVAFHASYVYIGAGLKAHQGIGGTELSQMVSRFAVYWRVILFMLISELSLGSVWFTLAVGVKRTMYPRWVAFLNPLIIFAAVSLFILALPAPVGGYVAPTVMNTATLVFVIVSMLLLRRMRRKAPVS